MQLRGALGESLEGQGESSYENREEYVTGQGRGGGGGGAEQGSMREGGGGEEGGVL